ncbi:hypothetical protein CONLIGDRAFT_668836, partial [Coniochaeta ligniaria NRRL 30616]
LYQHLARYRDHIESATNPRSQNRTCLANSGQRNSYSTCLRRRRTCLANSGRGNCRSTYLRHL